MPVHKKRLIIICSCLLTVIFLSVGVTIAYLGTAEKKENSVTIGKGNVSITESNWSEPEVQRMENENDKDVRITNTGTVPCFVRVYMDFSDSEVASVAKVKAANETYYSWSDFKTELAKDSNSYSPKWKYVGPNDTTKLNGYFYYTEKVAPNGVTEPLITAVQTDFNGNNNNDTNIDKIKDYNIIVYSETVQTIGKDTDYGTANNWYSAWKEFLRVP